MPIRARPRTPLNRNSPTNLRRPVTTLILANQSYAILKGEMANVGARNPGRRAMDMLTLDRPTLDWVALARGMGVPGERVENAESLADALGRGIATPGPCLVEAVF